MGGRSTGGSLLVRIVGGFGRLLIATGVLLLLFVAYQLWGTSIRTAQAQNQLEDELAELFAAAGELGVNASTSTTVGGPPTTAPPLPPELVPSVGDAVGQLVIPAIGVDWVFVEGVSVRDLKRGPGHYPETPMPGQAGNAAIAGHRTTYGQPFHNLDQLQPGDEVVVATVQGRFVYEVRETRIIRPNQVEVLGADFWDHDGDPLTVDNTLTLTACHPKYSARERIVVSAVLVGEPAPGRSGDDNRPTTPTDFDGGLSDERSGAGPAVLWGIIGGAIWLLAWAIGRWKPSIRWAAYAVGLLPFLVALFLFFENFSRLLPASY